ncbi:hypothetical protein, partial [Armatimonas sp.]|uniref:hypothetical protein n=1 Tax=Armatimonas sp. TaxID=1872638 RepID=UPI003751C127
GVTRSSVYYVENFYGAGGEPSRLTINAFAEDYRTKNSGTNRRVIAFIWDDSCRVQHHATLSQSVRSMLGIDDVVIISRPGNFSREIKANTDGGASSTDTSPLLT